jgi:hypothetical protein
MLKA